MSDNDAPSRKRRRPSIRLYLSMGALLLLIILSFFAALADIQLRTTVETLGFTGLILLTFLFTLLVFLYSVTRRAAGALLLLLSVLGASFALAVALWFVTPGFERLEPLATMLGLLLAFVGFLSSTGQAGELKLRFTEREDGVHIEIHMRFDDAEHAETHDTQRIQNRE